MNTIMTKEENFAERRKIFKDVWETAMKNDENEENDKSNTPKIIKTLRLSEHTKSGKKKKEKIKNLRSVCTKLLDYCDRQDADDLLYQKMAPQEIAQSKPVIDTDTKKKKRIKFKVKINKANSLYSSTNKVILVKTSQERAQSKPVNKTGLKKKKEIKLKQKIENVNSMGSLNKVTLSEKQASGILPIKCIQAMDGLSTRKNSKSKLSPGKASNLSEDGTILQKKIVKKKLCKRKKNIKTISML